MSVTAIGDVVPAVFGSREHLEAALADLSALGLRDDDLGVMSADPEHHRLVDDSTREALSGVERGALIGAPSGAVVSAGMLMLAEASLGALQLRDILTIAIPVGLVWGGLIGSYLGLVAQIHHLEDVEHRFEVPLQPTDNLVVVRAPDRAREVCAILERHGGRCAAEWLQQTSESPAEPVN
jgi:hypothetical protein